LITDGSTGLQGVKKQGGIGTELAAEARMPNVALDPFIHALFAHAVPVIIAAAIAGLLVGGLARRIEREIARGMQTMSGAFKRSSAQSQSPAHCQMENVPYCPACDAPMVKRSVQRAGRTGRQFWGCSNYPMCRITRPLLRT
jgi:hypothetical protein